MIRQRWIKNRYANTPLFEGSLCTGLTKANIQVDIKHKLNTGRNKSQTHSDILNWTLNWKKVQKK